jgi:hypothetical protein
MITLSLSSEGYTLTRPGFEPLTIPAADAPALLGQLIAAMAQRKDDTQDYARGHEEGLADGYARARRELETSIRKRAKRQAQLSLN